MTDRQLLINIRSQINAQLESCPEESDKLVIIPPKGNFTPPKGDFDGWVWAIPYWDGEEARESDGYKRYKTDDHRQHLGSDLMYRNLHRQSKSLPQITPWYHLASSTVPMLAMGPGTIWFAGETSTGWTVKIDHGTLAGFPLVTYYTHMSELFITEHPEGVGGQEVTAGMKLGFVGNSPKGEDPNHAHIEFWDYSDGVGGSRANRCLDPMLFLRCMGQVSLP